MFILFGIAAFLVSLQRVIRLISRIYIAAINSETYYCAPVPNSSLLSISRCSKRSTDKSKLIHLVFVLTKDILQSPGVKCTSNARSEPCEEDLHVTIEGIGTLEEGGEHLSRHHC